MGTTLAKPVDMARWPAWSGTEWDDRFSRLFGSLWPSRSDLPSATLEETDDAFVLEVDLPGVSKKDVSVEASDNRIAITGERKERERTGVLRRSTTVTGTFSYEVELPVPVNSGKIDAHMDDGVLILTAPKASEAKSTKVTIR